MQEGGQVKTDDNVVVESTIHCLSGIYAVSSRIYKQLQVPSQ